MMDINLPKILQHTVNYDALKVIDEMYAQDIRAALMDMTQVELHKLRVSMDAMDKVGFYDLLNNAVLRLKVRRGGE
jgi:hypothetical protein